MDKNSNEYRAGYKQALSEIKEEVDGIITALKKRCTPDPLGSTLECLTSCEVEALGLVLDIIKEKDK